MSFYPAKVSEKFGSPRCVGPAEGGSAEGTSASFDCGSFVKISLDIDADVGLIRNARFQTNGCGFMTAAADVVCESLTGKALVDLHGLPNDQLTEIVADELGRFPSRRVQCAVVVFEALHAALAQHRSRRIEEFQGEKALICTCFGVAEETIVEAIAANNLQDVGEVGEATRAGLGCGSCRMLIQELIDLTISSQ